MNPLKNLVDHMTLEQKIGQMICVGVSGSQWDRESQRLLQQYPFQNMGLFARNAASLRELSALTGELRQTLPSQCLGIPPMIAGDFQELSSLFCFPSLMALSASGLEEDARSLGQCFAQWLSDGGISHVLGPALYENQLAPQLVQALLQGLEEGGVSALPLVSPETTVLPAAWHSALLDEKCCARQAAVLRDSGFTGLLGCAMSARSETRSLAGRAVEMVRGGADLFIQCHSRQRQTALFTGLLQAVQSGALSSEEIDRAVLHILSSKVENGQIFSERHQLHPLEQQLAIGRIFRDSIIIVQDSGHFIPAYSKEYHRLLVIIPENNPSNLGEFLSSHFPETRVFLLPEHPSCEDLQALYRLADQCHLTVCCLPKGELSPSSASYLTSLSLRRPTIYVDAGSKPHALLHPENAALILSGSSCDTAMQAVSEIILGTLRSSGHLPEGFDLSQQEHNN